jgi:hypothetical protein
MYRLKPGPLCRLVVLVASFATILSCGDTVGSAGDARIGVIAFYGDPVVITVPDTVLVGQPFSASVRTYGNGCVSKGGTTVKLGSLTAEITPYDIHKGRICPAILNLFEHTAAMTLGQRGTAEITFHGWLLPEDVRISETRSLVVK